jgi:hypothetical protein
MQIAESWRLISNSFHRQARTLMVPSVQTTLQSLGVSKSVYAIPFPETERIFSRCMAAAETRRMLQKPYTMVQDAMGDDFFDQYTAWASPIIQINRASYPQHYPGNGSSEVIRETITQYIIERLQNGYEPSIHTFDGEYEGYGAYARDSTGRVITHNRQSYQETLVELMRPGEVFYLSQPSAIDGNVWQGYDEFIQWMQRELPEASIMLDLSYVGAVTLPNYVINVNYANIAVLFVSLSKSFGKFFDRIGGMLSRRAFPTLYGNRLWFKNLSGLRAGTEMMRELGPHDLPQKYANLQKEAVATLRETIGGDIRASDVLLMANQPAVQARTEVQRILTRGNTIRYCLTPAMDAMISRVGL